MTPAIVEAWRNAAVLGGVAAAICVLAQVRAARPWLAAVVVAGLGVAFWLGAAHKTWFLGSLADDAPWGSALLLAAWAAHGDTRWLRARSWPAVVLATALLGDRFVALGLSLCEPDPERRARLVVAASGASLVGWTSGAAPLVLGWGGLECVAVGLALAAVGFTRGGEVGRAAPDAREGAKALVVPLVGAVVAWLAIAGGTLELLADGLEKIPLLWLPRGDLLVYVFWRGRL